ncbi:MAG: hypothetical protein JSR93_07235 [Verrucomicrobia bacterium]|nr:hypothetical protein [Verrucomicrobiota bacterium]
MTAAIPSSPNHCYDLFIEPFNQGFYNIRDAVQGTKVSSVAQNTLDNPAPERELTLSERVSAAVVGILLIIPIVNAVVMAILKGIKSDLLYPTTANALSNTGTQNNPVPLVNDPPIAPLDLSPISPEQMIARKRGALERLAEIENMAGPADQSLIELNNRFRPHSQILRFNLDAVLQRYQTAHAPSKLYDFMDWADIPNDSDRNRFRNAVDPFENDEDEFHQPQEATVRRLLCNFAEYFEQQRARVGSGTHEETELKEQFARVYSSIIDADNNCIDQMLSQIQTLLLDIIAEGDAGSAGGSVQAKIISRAGLALCKYRQNLLREILVRQNPNNHHMADLEREVTQRVAQELGLQGRIFEAGAAYAFTSNLEAKVNRALDTFREEYKPFEHLVRELRTYHGAYQSLRNSILIWASEYYSFADEPGANLPDGTAAPDMEARLSEDPDNILSNGGNFNCPGLVLLLDALGLLRTVSA